MATDGFGSSLAGHTNLPGDRRRTGAVGQNQPFVCAGRCAQVTGLEPYAYLFHLLEELPKASTTDALEELLPWNVKPLLKAAHA